MRSFPKIVLVLLASSMAALAADSPKLASPVTFDQTVDRVVERERSFVTRMKTLHPLAETYIQNLHEDSDHNVQPTSDQYFLGRLDLNAGPRDTLFEKQSKGLRHRISNPFSDVFSYKFLPQGFAQMVILDGNFEKSNYHFSFVRREFLGEVRCIVMDIQPAKKAPNGAFEGRI